ncbi:MAG: DoxX family protein [Solirubrobacterales bacterium]|nr:DoxX family protein [Solirubrobacterales bacterium]
MAILTTVRRVSGLAFFIAGIPKFSSHSFEVSHFTTYGLPHPSAFVYLIGALEIAGGLMLLANVGVRPAALLLGAIMVGAIVVSGFGQGEVVPSLTVAPVLLAAMAFLLWSAEAEGSGRRGNRLRSRPAPR